MTPEKITKVCDEYRTILDDYGCTPSRLDDRESLRLTLGTHRRFRHLRFMCDEIPKLVDEGRIEKSMRWLGFLQGAMWALGEESLDSAKRRNMPEST